MDPVTITIIVIITGGTATACGVNPIYVILGLLSMLFTFAIPMAFAFLPFAAIISVIDKFIHGTLDRNTIDAAFLVLGAIPMLWGNIVLTIPLWIGGFCLIYHYSSMLPGVFELIVFYPLTLVFCFSMHLFFRDRFM